MFREAYLSSWKPVYFSASEIKGAIWNLSLKLRRKHSLSFRGVGSLPPYWDELVAIIKGFINGKDSDI